MLDHLSYIILRYALDNMYTASTTTSFINCIVSYKKSMVDFLSPSTNQRTFNIGFIIFTIVGDVMLCSLVVLIIWIIGYPFN